MMTLRTSLTAPIWTPTALIPRWTKLSLTTLHFMTFPGYFPGYFVARLVIVAIRVMPSLPAPASPKTFQRSTMTPIRLQAPRNFTTAASLFPSTLLPEHDHFYGDTLQLPKPDNVFRIATKNINHLSVNKIDNQITLLCRDQKRLEIDLQGIIEHKVDTNKYHIRQAFHASTRTVFEHATVELGSSEYKSVTDYKPGGTAIIAQGDVTGRIHLHESDKYGRWSYMSTQGAKGLYTICITAYQVNKKPAKKTGTTAYHQQQAAFITEKRTNLNPRHNLRRDLIKFIQQHQNKGHRIVLSGDFNEHIHDHNSFLQEVSLQCKLIDIWKQRFPQSAEPNTYILGSRRIDYVLISQELSPAVLAVGYEPFHYTLPTDHCGIFIDFRTDLLFGNAHNPLPAAKHRKLQSKYTE
jgi:hypothetical protein